MARSFSDTEDIRTIARSLEAFRSTHLSESTRIPRVVCYPQTPIQETILTGPDDINALPSTDPSPCYQLFFTYKHLIERPSDSVPNDANKLRISVASLESLAKHLTLPAAFIFALTRHYMPNGRGSRKIDRAGSTKFDSWYFLPVRVQVESGGSNNPVDNIDSTQMNPFHKLHLPDVQRDIHRSCIGIFSRVDPVSKKFTFACFDFMHGRWPKVALEPKERIAAVLKRHTQTADHFGREYCVHLAFLTSATRWWTNSLNSVNDQLIAYERKLQAELDREETTPEQALTELNRALHSIAAHLQRYLSEFKSLQGIIADLSTDYKQIHASEISTGTSEDYEQARRGFAQVQSQVDAAHDFAVELEKKTQNILALLFNRMQISNDRLLVANGRAMQAILRAMQADANLAQSIANDSYKLSQEMKKDSVAMKTIAIVTMFFLPGATFATLLSMPFFSENEWMSHASRFWLWIVLSVPSTAACFAFYDMWRRRAQKAARVQRAAYETREHGVALGDLPTTMPNGHAH